jgi:hypothetical protein
LKLFFEPRKPASAGSFEETAKAATSHNAVKSVGRNRADNLAFANVICVDEIVERNWYANFFAELARASQADASLPFRRTQILNPERRGW